MLPFFKNINDSRNEKICQWKKVQIEFLWNHHFCGITIQKNIGIETCARKNWENLWSSLKDNSLLPKSSNIADSITYTSTIISIIFWDFLMFLPIFPSPQVKRWAITTYKHGINKLPHKLPNDIKLRILGN